jgi:hypothetical protein
MVGLSGCVGRAFFRMTVAIHFRDFHDTIFEQDIRRLQIAVVYATVIKQKLGRPYFHLLAAKGTESVVAAALLSPLRCSLRPLSLCPRCQA